MTSRLDAIKARADGIRECQQGVPAIRLALEDVPALVAALEAALNMPGEVVECGYPLDSEWASGYTAALVDVRAVIRQALGEVEQ